MTFSKLLAQSLLWRGLYFITLFGVNIVLSRSLQASGSGAIFYIANTFAFVQLIAGLCLETGITFFGASKLITGNQLLWLCLLWTLFIIVLQLAVFHFFSFPVKELSASNVSQYAFCYITGSLLIIYSSSLFYANGNFFIPNLVLSVLNIFFVVFVLLKNSSSVSTASETIISVYFLLFLLQGIVITIACIAKNQSWRAIALPSYIDIKKLLRYSLTVLLFNVLLFLVYRIDYYFVRYSPVCSANDLGNYIQASKLGQMLLVVPQIIGSAVYPQVSSGKDMISVSRIIAWLIKVLAFLFLFLFLLILVIGKWLFPFLFGDSFQQVQMPLLLLLPGIYGLAIISFISNFFSGQGNVKISVGAASMGLVVVLSLDAIFVSKYGIDAAAIISSIGYLVMFTPYLFRFIKENNLSYKHLLRINKEDFLLIREMLKQK